MEVIMGDYGFSYLVRLLGIIQQSRWDNLLVHHNERSKGCRNNSDDYYPGDVRAAGLYIYRTVNWIPGVLVGCKEAIRQYVWFRNAVTGGG